ncbi:MAG TPA: M48 family metalloprotease [Abditibacteriaceae bacterium]|nr:M48 family metalloprotease [Abditibacteriaceae bacterium]
MTFMTSKTRNFATPSRALLLAATATALWSAAPAQAGLLSVSEKEEIEAGKKVAAQARKEYGGSLAYDDPMSRRVRAIGMRFARLSARKNIPYTYEVLKNDKVLNAFAAPGGPIFVTRKLVTTSANDAELAYVLGHETIHIDHKHIVKAVEKQQKVGLAAGILGAILGRGSGGDVVGTIANIGWTVISRGYSRDQETDSDIGGVRWMSQLGFDPRAAVTMLGKLGGGNSGFLDKYLATHPDPKSRQAKVQQLITSENLLDVARRSGGPTLGASSSAQGGYANTGYPPSNDSTYYPPSSGGNGTYPSGDDYTYPADDGYGDNSYPPADDGTPPTYPGGASGSSGEIQLSTPIVVAKQGEYQVIMAPAAGVARWAGATVRTNGTITTLQRGNTSIELRLNSTVAQLNRRTVKLSAAPRLLYGTLYAPVGALAEGVGATASCDGNARVVRLQRNNGTTGVVRVP